MQQKTSDEEPLARAYVLRLLSRRGYFSKELREKMRRKGYSEEVVEKMIKLCNTRGYLNDEERSRSVVAREKEKGRGPRRIAMLLKTKGALTQKAADELQTFDQKAAILSHLAKLKKRANTREKLIMALMRRGFDFDAILSCLEGQ